MSNSQEYRNHEAARRERDAARTAARKGKHAAIVGFTPINTPRVIK